MCTINDVYPNRIVGYSMDSKMTPGLALSALRNAIALREPAATVIVHSDRGSPIPVRCLLFQVVLVALLSQRDRLLVPGLPLTSLISGHQQDRGYIAVQKPGHAPARIQSEAAGHARRLPGPCAT
jgi:hypothetical protein